jgi:hypothetical protein
MLRNDYSVGTVHGEREDAQEAAHMICREEGIVRHHGSLYKRIAGGVERDAEKELTSMGPDASQ